GMLSNQRFNQLRIAALHRIDQAEIAGQTYRHAKHHICGARTRACRIGTRADARTTRREKSRGGSHECGRHTGRKAHSYKYASRPVLSPKPLQGTPALSNILRKRLFNGVSEEYAIWRLPLKNRLPAISAIGRS